MKNLETQYLGLTLKNPVVMSSSPLTEKIENVRKLEDAGASAIVMHSLFEEQISLESQDLDHYLTHGAESFAEAVTYFTDLPNLSVGPEDYLETVRRAKDAVEVPIIGSLNGVSTGGWIRYAKRIEEAGADALELNVYYMATEPEIAGGDVERMYLELVEDIVSSVRIPVAVKLSPYFSAPAAVARKLVGAGAKGLVLFNRFYQPDFDLENLEVVPNLDLSSPRELRPRLRWVAVLHDHVEADLAVTGGVHSAQDVIKCMMAGAKVAMMTSAILIHQIPHITKVVDGIKDWMEEHEYESIQQMQGSMSQRAVAEPAAFERANYMRVLRTYAREHQA
ncbi:MAG: dihydroorotate dehydrogenase-like protein [Candidatus Eisenbacteria bacterium]|nr:dihydroorotate dehydrogenase-like protein [Candidatus Eisenbacteria bacterium]